MIALLCRYDKSDRLHVLVSTHEVDDLAQAVRVVGQLHRAHVRTECPNCTISHWTVTEMLGQRSLPRILDGGLIRDLPGMA